MEPQSLSIDYLLEKAAVRKLSDEERKAAMRELAQKYLTRALEADRRAKKG